MDPELWRSAGLFVKYCLLWHGQFLDFFYYCRKYFETKFHIFSFSVSSSSNSIKPKWSGFFSKPYVESKSVDQSQNESQPLISKNNKLTSTMIRNRVIVVIGFLCVLVVGITARIFTELTWFDCHYFVYHMWIALELWMWMLISNLCIEIWRICQEFIRSSRIILWTASLKVFWINP